MSAPDLTTQMKARSIALAIETATNEKPAVSFYDDGHAELTFDTEQVKRLRKYLEAVIAKAGGEQKVKINALPILAPILIKKLLPAVLGLVAAGYILAVLTRK